MSTCGKQIVKFVVSVLAVGSGEQNKYSHLSNKRGGWNKPGGGAKNAKSPNVEGGIKE